MSTLGPEAGSTAREAVRDVLDGLWRLVHPNIVSILEVHEVKGVPCLVEEFVDGQPLSRHCKVGTLLPPRTAVEIVARAAEALDHAHANGVVHGDVKPGNLFRVGESAVKITDFSIAAALRTSSGQAELPGEVPGYMSPEQVRGRPLDARSDLFSLSAVLYELLSGDPPFPGDSPSSIVYRIVHEPPRDPTTFEPPVPVALSRVLMRGLAKRPEGRFDSGAKLAQSLREAERARESEHPEALPETSRERVDIEREAPAVASPERAAPVAEPASGAAPRGRRSGVLAGIVLLTLAALAVYALRGPLGLADSDVPEVWWEAQVRTEPPGLEVSLDGVPLEAGEAGTAGVRFMPEGPFGTLSVEHGCRVTQRQIQPADAGVEIVLVLDPLELTWQFDSELPGAVLSLDGERVGPAPAEVRLDLCRDTRLLVEAPGYRPASLEVPAGATPLEARRVLYGLALERIPIGRLVLREHPEIQLIFYVDGKRMGSGGREIELQEGEHQVRFKNEYHFIDERRTVRVAGGQTVTAELGAQSLATLVVQAFPSNCKVYLRTPGGSWRYMDETPAQRRVATGRYEVKVELIPTAETTVRQVDLVAGGNPPVRVAFGNR